MAKFCKKCGSPITPGTKFCKKCGASVQEISTAEKTQPQPKISQPTPQNNSQENSSSSKKIGTIILAVAILAGGGGAAYYFLNNGTNISAESEQNKSEEEKNPVEKKSETPVENSAKPEEKKSDSEIKSKKSGPLDAEDLKLGELSIGDSKEKVSKILGKPLSTKEAQRQIVWKFDDMEVTLNSAGQVTGLVSNFSDIATPRGIMEGMPEKEVFKAYGTGYKESTYENLNLYEYEIKHTENASCILRFAVRKTDHRIEYISIRVAD